MNAARNAENEGDTHYSLQLPASSLESPIDVNPISKGESSARQNENSSGSRKPNSPNVVTKAGFASRSFRFSPEVNLGERAATARHWGAN
jgi:hypothetical protein